MNQLEYPGRLWFLSISKGPFFPFFFFEKPNFANTLLLFLFMILYFSPGPEYDEAESKKISRSNRDMIREEPSEGSMVTVPGKKMKLLDLLYSSINEYAPLSIHMYALIFFELK